MQDLVSKATGDSPKRLKRKAKKFITAKARLQYGEEVKEVSIQVQESEMKKITNIVDRLVTTGSTQMRKYVNVKIMDFKNKSREIFPDIPTESVVVFRDVHQMADIIFGKHLAKSLAAWDARINDRIATHENKVFRHCLRDLHLSSNSDHFKSRAQNMKCWR